MPQLLSKIRLKLKVKESSIPLSDNKTSLTNQVTATTTTRNNNKRFRVLVATKDTKAKTYTKPSNPNYAYLTI